MRIVDTIDFWARILPHRAAIIQSDMVLTYLGLADFIESIGERIDRVNLNRGEPVAVCLANPAMTLATVFALLRRGYSVAPVNAGLVPYLADAGIRNTIDDVEGQVASAGRNVKFDISWLPSAPAGLAKRARQKRSNDESSLIFFTSGTTGSPKRVVMPTAALDARLSYPFTCATGPYQKVLILLGLATNIGFNRACEVLCLGKTACFSLVDGALSLITLFGIEVIAASPAQVLGLVDLRKRNPSHRLDSIKAIFMGGGKIDSAGIGRIRGALCRNVINDYGSTEAGTVGLTPFDVVADGSSTIIFPWVDLEVVDEEGDEVRAGMEGVIRIQSPQLRENLKATGSNAVPGTRDGWFYPGDIGVLDENGMLNLQGRCSDVINCGGVKVSALRVEEILSGMPGIKEAAACGMPGSSGLEELWVGVVPNGPIDIDQVKARLRDDKEIRIEPDEVVVLDKLPRGDLGKVQKLRLKHDLIKLRRTG
jgi:acyl-coenzyme A synthetase/AMP-(fatty) acid ligase